jgi:GMP synthase (glutamine-hydrolysing)
MSNRVLIIRHGDDPPDDRVNTYLHLRGFDPVTIRPCNGDPVPQLDNTWAGSVVHGGPFSVFEERQHPFLREEHRWISQCIERELPLLGICQGAQSIAYVLGAEVGPPESGLHEFGYYELTPTADGIAEGFLTTPLHATQAHFHTFALPEGATLLASSQLYPNQAYRHGARTYGVQFHPEVTIEGFRRWQAAPWAAYGAPGVQTREEQDALMLEHDAAQAKWFYGFLESLFGSRAGGDPFTPLGAATARR